MKYHPLKIVNFRHSISTRLLRIVFSIYFLLTLFITGGNIFIEYSAAIDDIKNELVITEQTFKHSLSESLWNFDTVQLKITTEGITKLPAIIGVEILNPKSEVILRTGEMPSKGNISSVSMFWHKFSLLHAYQYSVDNKEQIVGYVRFISSNTVAFNRIKLGLFILIIGAIIKTAALIFIISIVFNRLLTRPLGELAKNAENIDVNNIKVDHIKIEGHDESELKVLEAALNKMIDKIVTSMSELDESNKDLERKVSERTNSLNTLVDQLDNEQKVLQHEVANRKEKEKDLLQGRLKLQNSLNELKQTQEQLIESEKMASLGELVAGVAHEINTPVGLSLTGISHFQYMLERLETRYKGDELDEQQFEKFVSDAKEIAQSIHISLSRAAGLVKSFKLIAVDQAHEMIRWFNIHDYINEVMVSLQNKIKHTAVEVKIECDPSIEINGYPGSWSQIITNFINNSLIHAYEKNQKGNIKLLFKRQGDKLHFIYSDDGKGQGKEIQDKMFNPFFTTNREHGGTGLGLNIVYNLVTQKMKGNIKVNSEPDFGTTFTIIIPIDITKIAH